MAAEFEEYLAVLKASYDYDPQSDDEIAIKENQILFLKERVDEDWWKVKIKGESQDDDSPVGLVPAAYVELADHSSVVKALYDYEANAPGELSVKENELLLVFDTEDSWLLVQSQKEGGKAGFVPGNYVEAASEEGEAPQATSAPQIVVPPSPPRPVSTYADPADRVASTKVKADDIKTWSVSEVDKKGKKKKGTLGVGNGAVFFASESDKTPVQKWKTIDIEKINIEKSKHVHIELGGSTPISLHFNTGSKDNAEGIVAKLESSKELSAPPSTSPQPVDRSSTDTTSRPPPIRTDLDHKQGKKSGASVHFSASSPAIIPPREPSDDEDDLHEPEQAEINGGDDGDDDDDAKNEADTANALYDFAADGDDELSVAEGERLVVLEKDGDEWWKCRNARGDEGVVPASYLELSSTGNKVPLHTAVEDDSAAREAKERAEVERLEREQAEKERAEKERAEKERKKLDAQQREKAAASAADAERKRRKDAARAATPPSAPPPPRGSSQSSDSKRTPADNSTSSSSSRSSTDNNTRPPPEKTRVWHDRSGQFRVEAAFLGFNNGKLRLHKVNGVIVEVPAEKMSVEDMRFVEKMTSKRQKSTAPRVSDDDTPLALQRPVNSVATTARAAQQPKKVPKIDWFDFFLSAGCDLDDCTRYASSFERDKIDESILPDITESTMRSLGLREGDIIRVTKAIEKRNPKKNGVATPEQLVHDEDLARQLQAEENGAPPRKQQTTSPAPNLFAGPGGALKNTARRGRPQPSKSLPPTSVDLNAIATVSDQIQRTSSPQLLSPTINPTTNIRPSSTPVQPPPRSSSALAATSGFEDDAWTNRPSSTKPIAAVPPTATGAAPRAPSAPPTNLAPPPTQPPSAQPAQLAAAPQPAQSPNSASLAKTTESDIFEQLSRLSELRKNQPITPPAMSASPSTVGSVPASYQSGLGMGSSPAPMAHHLQNQQANILPRSSPQPYNGPRGPFAPVPANHTLLQPLIPTQTGFNSFVPTRPGTNTSPFQGQPQPPSFLGPQPTGFSGLQPVMSQPTGIPFGGFGSGNSFQNNGFGQVQSNPTGLNPSFGQLPFNNGLSPPPVPPIHDSVANNTSPANIFAQMKSGTFATDHETQNPQSSDMYDALRPNPLAAQATGWGGYQGGYMGYQH